VIDGEIVVAHEGRLDFQALLERLDARGSGTEARPAAPACFVAFDLLALGEVDLRPAGFGERRRQPCGGSFPRHAACRDAPDGGSGDRPRLARGSGRQGVRGDRGEADLPSLPIWETSEGEGEALAERRSGRGRLLGPSGGSLVLLGAYDEQGVLHHVGQTVVFSPRERVALRVRSAPLEGGRSFGGGLMPGRGRWESHRFDEWVPLEPDQICEVEFSRIDGGFIRHLARFVRWRDDKSKEECTISELAPVGAQRP
jgi:ATP-dependent DNA ligase